MHDIEEKLEGLGITLPDAPSAYASYVPYVISGKNLYIAGQIPFINGEKRHIARLGDDYTIQQGKEAAKDCALNILAQLNSAIKGDWNRLVRCVKLGGFVNSTPDFIDQPAVINGASEFMVEILGEKGRHARFAVGSSSLPLGVAVEIDAIFEITDEA